MTTPALVALIVCGVIDQIDGGVAAVEWSGPDPDPMFEWFPAAWLPEGSREGDQLCVRVRIQRPRPKWFRRGPSQQSAGARRLQWRRDVRRCT